MGQPVVHFEIVWQDPDKLQSYYGDKSADLGRWRNRAHLEQISNYLRHILAPASLHYKAVATDLLSPHS